MSLRGRLSGQKIKAVASFIQGSALWTVRSSSVNCFAVAAVLLGSGAYSTGLGSQRVASTIESFVGSTDTSIGKSFNPFAFATQKVVMLVDDGNFLAWKQHVLLVLKTHRLLPFVERTITVPPRLISGEDGTPVENLAYAHYEQQDSALSAWLLSVVSLSFNNKLIGSSSSSFELWDARTRILST
ncbi:hypothetical protein GOBAR_DD12879 [Gossypium barbadense]|nr:hypothetical protein GOBAR_DD12879 [Gossypium barbadense]